MIEEKVIIVGGGPAGAACAWKLKQRGIMPLVLDKYAFPRPKVCAGWVTPDVFRLLELQGGDYPYTISQFDRIYFHLFGIKIPVPKVTATISSMVRKNTDRTMPSSSETRQASLPWIWERVSMALF